jgi:hypothetical protein
VNLQRGELGKRRAGVVEMNQCGGGALFVVDRASALHVGAHRVELLRPVVLLCGRGAGDGTVRLLVAAGDELQRAKAVIVVEIGDGARLRGNGALQVGDRRGEFLAPVAVCLLRERGCVDRGLLDGMLHVSHRGG